VIGVDKNTTIVFPLPIDLIEPLQELMRRAGLAMTSPNGSNGSNGSARATMPPQIAPPRQEPPSIPPGTDTGATPPR
jgi:hypothetical protein